MGLNLSKLNLYMWDIDFVNVDEGYFMYICIRFIFGCYEIDEIIIIFFFWISLLGISVYMYNLVY